MTTADPSTNRQKPVFRALDRVADERDIDETTIANLATHISAAPYSKARATEVGSCGRISFGRRRRRGMPGIAVFIPEDSFIATITPEHAADHGIDGDEHDQPWSDHPVNGDELSTLSDPADAAATAVDVFRRWAADDDLSNAAALSWGCSPLIAIFAHAANRSSLPDVEIWHGELTETGRACFGRNREGERGFAVFVPTPSLWDDPGRVIEAIEEPWW